ncbi:hypothetical protein cypCar_00047486 [Cyprinus carpio]|nr:hypothetical protein cypCar_00047486 [Cyprinus carpio]
MKLLRTVSVFLLMVSSSVCVDITVTGTEGGQVTIKCPYAKGYENSYKYFYKGIYRDRNIILTSYGRKSSDGRFSLCDDHQMRTFTVIIRKLSLADAGPYGCRAGWGEYKQIQLNVVRDLVPVAGGLGSVLLVLVLCSGTFLILKKRKRKSGTASFQQNVPHNTETERMYEEIPNSLDVTTASSSNQTPASHLFTRPHVCTVYATVTNQQPDSNLHHTHLTNQLTDTDWDYYANIKFPEATTDNRTELIYTTVTHPQNIKTNIDPKYSVIKNK